MLHHGLTQRWRAYHISGTNSIISSWLSDAMRCTRPVSYSAGQLYADTLTNMYPRQPGLFMIDLLVATGLAMRTNVN